MVVIATWVIDVFLMIFLLSLRSHGFDMRKYSVVFSSVSSFHTKAPS